MHAAAAAAGCIAAAIDGLSRLAGIRPTLIASQE